MANGPGTRLYWACLLRDWEFPHTGRGSDVLFDLADFLLRNDYNSLDQLAGTVHPKEWIGASRYSAGTLDALWQICRYNVQHRMQSSKLVHHDLLLWQAGQAHDA